VRQHLRRELYGLKEFQPLPKSVETVDGPISSNWSERVCFVEGETGPRIQIQLGEKYDYYSAYRLARQRRNPYLSPHGMFYKLENGLHVHAVEFMDRFGPLTWKFGTGRRGEEGWVKLSDFWDRHTRFVGVVQLWENRSHPEKLKGAWRWIHKRLNRINRIPPAEFGAMPTWNLDRYMSFPSAFPWEKGGIEQGLQVPYSFLFHTTLEVIHCELNLHTQNECRQVWMMQPIDQDVRFEPIRSYGSLWGVVWDLFGQDISKLTHGWRICLECGDRFYPKDHRSVCCSTKHQGLWSKRKWAREHRAPRVSREGQ